jgi:hypothetical protein
MSDTKEHKRERKYSEVKLDDDTENEKSITAYILHVNANFTTQH